jgi:pilus assembly protein CpaC
VDPSTGNPQTGAAIDVVPLPLPLPTRSDNIPRVIPIEPIGIGSPPPLTPVRPHVIEVTRDTSGLVAQPPMFPPARTATEVAKDVANLIQVVTGPEAEICVAEGQAKIIETRQPPLRIAVANPAIADVELFNDQPRTRLLNLYGRSFGTTTLTIWDDKNHPTSFLVRVTLDTFDLQSRIRLAFPGCDVKVRQVGWEIILEGQVSDSKTLSDVLQLVTSAVLTSQSMRGGAAGGGAGGGGGSGMGGGMGGGGGGMGGGAGGGAAGGGGVGRLLIINRLTVPGPRQILLHVKIAEINRTATRNIGVSWLYARGKSLIGSAAGTNATLNTTANVTNTQTTGPRGFIGPLQSTYSSNGTSAPAGNSPLFGVFDAGRFSLFIDALRTNALAKILAEPNLVALDGQPARFLVGGMFPYPVPQSSSLPGGTAVVTVQFQRFGTILTFLPTILANDVIRLDVEPVISQLNYAQFTMINGGIVPSITERSARTVVELREGQSLAIAGLIQRTTNATTSRIPGLGDLPLVGPWFSANSIETIEYETVVLVTPELVSPLERNEVTEAPGDRVFQPSDAEFYFLGRIEGKLGREFRATVGQQDPLNLMRHFQSEDQWVIGPHGYAD